MLNLISAVRLKDKLKQGEACCIVDIRTVEEYRAARLKAPSIHLPFDELDAGRLRDMTGNTSGPIYLLCRSGGRTRCAAGQLAAEGFDNVAVVEGGLMACKAAGMDIE
ncbi:MAG: rhodanese-like domain-containing protein [Alphaproteobacteria bacterium]|nr:rhodanese-like domain-containing protein [Alphaproteobacteria bacterium]